MPVMLNFPMYMQDVISHYKSIIKQENTYYPQMYLDKVSIIKEKQIFAAFFLSFFFHYPLSFLKHMVSCTYKPVNSPDQKKYVKVLICLIFETDAVNRL